MVLGYWNDPDRQTTHQTSVAGLYGATNVVHVIYFVAILQQKSE